MVSVASGRADGGTATIKHGYARGLSFGAIRREVGYLALDDNSPVVI